MFSTTKSKNAISSGKSKGGILKNSHKPAKKISEILSQCNHYQENGVQVVESGHKVIFYCTLCQAWAHNDHTLEEHLKGKKHTFNKSCNSKKDVTPAVKNFVESVTKQSNWFVKVLDPNLPEWMHYWPTDTRTKKTIKSKFRIHPSVHPISHTLPENPLPVPRNPSINILSQNSREADLSHSQALGVTNNGETSPVLFHNNSNVVQNSQTFIDLSDSDSETSANLPLMSEFLQSALILFCYNDKLGREKGQLMPNSRNASSMDFDDSPYSIPSESKPVHTLCAEPDAAIPTCQWNKHYPLNEKKSVSDSRPQKQVKNRERTVPVNERNEESFSKVKGNELVCLESNSHKLGLGVGKKGWMKEMEMKKKVFQQGIYKRHKINQKMCYICQQCLENGSQVATILNLNSGEFACSSRNRFGMFHVFHSLCLGNWVAYILTLMICNDENEKNNIFFNMSKNSFCPECQGTGAVYIAPKLEKPRFQLNEVYDMIFEMIKSQNHHSKLIDKFSEKEKEEYRKNEFICRLHFSDPVKQKVAESISKNLKTFWFGSPDFESVMSITRH